MLELYVQLIPGIFSGVPLSLRIIYWGVATRTLPPLLNRGAVVEYGD